MATKTKKAGAAASSEARSRRPAVLAHDPAGVPEELKALNRWVLWRNDRRPGHEEWAKTPYTPAGDRKAASNRPADWAPYAACMARYEQGGFDGPGFVFAPADGLLGVDLDACRDPFTGDLTAHARAVLVRLNGYSEVSPSGRGVKAFVRASRPAGARCVFRDGPLRVEVYSTGRYFAVTGRRLTGFPDWLAERQAQVDALYAENFLVPVAEPARSRRLSTGAIARGNGPDAAARAAAYALACPPAVSGCNGHGTTFAVARAVVWGFALGADEGFRVLWDVYNPSCRPPWKASELRHKCQDADTVPSRFPRGYLLERRVAR